MLPTGGGKTVIYSVAAVVLSGITFVIQLLKSLMEGKLIPCVKITLLLSS